MIPIAQKISTRDVSNSADVVGLSPRGRSIGVAVTGDNLYGIVSTTRDFELPNNAATACFDASSSRCVREMPCPIP